RRGGTGTGNALPAHGGAVLSASWRGHRALLRISGRRPGRLAGVRRHGTTGDRPPRRRARRVTAGHLCRHRSRHGHRRHADDVVGPARRMASMSLSERLADARDAPIPAAMRETAEKLLVDVAGLCVAARAPDSVRAALKGWEASGACTALGHSRTL